MVTYKKLADDIKTIIHTPSSAFNTKKTDDLDLLIYTNFSEYFSQEYIGDNMRYATRKVTDDIVLIDVRLVTDINGDKVNLPSTLNKCCYFCGTVYLIHISSLSDNSFTYLQGLLKYVDLCINNIIPRNGVSAEMDMYAEIFILLYIVNKTSYLTEMQAEEDKLFSDVLYETYDYPETVKEKFIKLSKDPIIDNDDFITILLDKNAVFV